MFDEKEREAIQIVMRFYKVSEEEAITCYWDEVEAYIDLKEKGIL